MNGGGVSGAIKKDGGKSSETVDRPTKESGSWFKEAAKKRCDCIEGQGKRRSLRIVWEETKWD